MQSVVYLGITSHCNLSCKHCYMSDEYRNLSISIEKSLTLLKDMHDVGIVKIVHTHGELFLHKNWKDFVLQAKKLEFVQHILTNGMLINEERCKVIDECKIHKVIISLDSINPDTHNSNRNNSKAWQGLLTAINLLKKNTNSIIGLNTVLNPWVGDELQRIYDFALEKGIQELYLLPYHNSYSNLNKKEELEYIKLNIKNMVDLLSYSKGKSCNILMHDPYLTFLLKKQGVSFGEDKCGAGNDYLSIHANGDVFPCNFIPIKIGNIFEEEFINICKNAIQWRNDLDHQIRVQCGQCIYFNMCDGGCRAFGLKNLLTKKDFRCVI